MSFRATFDIAGMADLNDASPNLEAWLVFGYDFGPDSERTGYKPTTVGGL